jgi:hypothetical protein
MLKEKDELSEKIKAEFDEKLAQIDSKLEEGGVHFKNLMDELKDMQSKLRSEDVKRDIKNILFDNIQSTFEKIKVKRDNVLGGANNSRISGLQTVLDRIQKTLDLDKKDLDFNLKKLNVVNNKLELQLREAKIKVLKDRISSKEEKVADINKTLQKLTKKSTITKEIILEEASEIIENIKQEGEDILSSIGEKLQDLKEKFNEKTVENQDHKPEEKEKAAEEKPTER